MKNLENFDSKIVVASTVYYDKENLQEFVEVFSSVKIIDYNLKQYVDIINKCVLNKQFDSLPPDPQKRRKKIISLILSHANTIAQKLTREKFLAWFEEACDYDSDIELSEELLYRYCWSEFLDRVELEDKSKKPFKEKLNIKPNIPDIGEKKFKRLSEIELPDEKEEEDVVFKTGLKSFDNIVKMRPTNFVLVAARTTIGKSLFMINQAVYNASQGIPVLYVSLEESKEELRKRVALHIKNNNEKTNKKILDNFIVFNPTVSSPQYILGEISNFIEENNVRVVFIDYVQLMKYDNMSDWDSLRALSRELKLFAIRENILLCTASQLKRDAEYTGSNLTNLYGSSTLEADANIVIILESARKQNVRINNVAATNICINKNRSGEQGKIENVLIDYSCGHINIDE